MDIFLKYEVYYNEDNELVVNQDLMDHQLDTFINLFTNKHLDIRVYQLDAHKKFFDMNDNYSEAVRFLVNDIKDNSSFLSFLLKGTFMKEGQSDLERQIAIFKHIFSMMVLRQYRDQELEGKYYFFPYYKNYGFKFFLPQEILDEKYEGKDQEIDLSLLSNDEFLRCIVPDYYLDLGYWDRAPLRDRSEIINKLPKDWGRKKNIIVSLFDPEKQDQ